MQGTVGVEEMLLGRRLSAMKTKPSAVTALESTLISHLRFREGLSRVALARAMDVAPSTVGLYVDRLIENGFVLEGRKSRGQAGRPSITLELNSKAGQFVGVDFEARQISATAVDFSQRTLERRQETIGAADNAESVVAKIKDTIAAVAIGRRPLLGIGVAVPGSVDGKRGVALHYEFIRDWKNVPLVEKLSEHFDVPIHLENNIRAMALAERWFGQAIEVDNFVCLGIRSGIGAGVIVRGQLLRGINNLAGEIGGWHRPPAPGAPADSFSTLEQQASVRAILRQISEAAQAGRRTSLKVSTSQPLALADVLVAAREGDALVREVLLNTGRVLGQTISQLNLLLNPEQIVIAGPLAQLGNIFLDPIREVVASLTPPLHAQPPRIVASQLGEFGGALGAAAMAVNQWKPAR
jgi:N-acetylglucosamine repressor